MRGFKPCLPGSFGIRVGALFKRAVLRCAVSNRAYRVHDMRGFTLRLPGSFGIRVGALSKRAVLKLRGFKPRLPDAFGFLNRLGDCVEHIAGYQSVHAQGCRGDVTRQAVKITAKHRRRFA